jgi:hypothetical protein
MPKSWWKNPEGAFAEYLPPALKFPFDYIMNLREIVKVTKGMPAGRYS